VYDIHVWIFYTSGLERLSNGTQNPKVFKLKVCISIGEFREGLHVRSLALWRSVFYLAAVGDEVLLLKFGEVDSMLDVGCWRRR